MYKNGWITKQGRTFKARCVTWRRRWAVLHGTTLKYYATAGGKLRGTIPLAGGRVEAVEESRFSRKHCSALVTPARTLFFFTEDGAAAVSWREALQAAIDGRSTAASSPPPPPMPDVLDIDGVAEVGAELRVRAAGSLLDALCVAWFRVTPAASPPNPADDPAKAPGVVMIRGATIQTYSATAEDVGCRIGVLVTPATGDLFFSLCMPSPVVAVDARAPAARLRLRPHVHHKYCDRRVRVCTAEGRYREGESVLLRTRGDQASQYRVIWTRSQRVVGSRGNILLDEEPGADAADGTRVSFMGRAESDVSDAPSSPLPASRSPALSAVSSDLSVPSSRPGAGADEDEEDVPAPTARERALTQARVQRIIRLTPEQLARLEYRPVSAAPATHLAPTPAAHEEAPTPAQHLGPTAAAEALDCGDRDAADGGPAGRREYAFFADDVGCLVRAELHPVDTASGLPVLLSPAVGPVEPAPPRVRAVWVEGVPRVGECLTGRWWYFGGEEGASEVEWVRVQPDGDTSIVAGPYRIHGGPGLAPVSAAVLRSVEAGSATHACVYRIAAHDRECVFKFRVRPIRADGDEGHAEASKPTPEIRGADEDALMSPTAPTVGWLQQAAQAWKSLLQRPEAEGIGLRAPVGSFGIGGAEWIELMTASAELGDAAMLSSAVHESPDLPPLPLEVGGDSAEELVESEAVDPSVTDAAVADAGDVPPAPEEPEVTSELEPAERAVDMTAV